jgi:hypothetical protein
MGVENNEVPTLFLRVDLMYYSLLLVLGISTAILLSQTGRKDYCIWIVPRDSSSKGATHDAGPSLSVKTPLLTQFLRHVLLDSSCILGMYTVSEYKNGTCRRKWTHLL